MTASDITRWGGLPRIFVNVLDVNTLGERDSEVNDMYREMITGLKEVARQQRLVCFSGEIAELGSCVWSENQDARTKFNWAGFMLGVYHPDLMITGDSLEEGQLVISLQENGFRSNGLSSVRAALRIRFGED
jgi:phosphoribosylaminoimidazole (AIR) synthetase